MEPDLQPMKASAVANHGRPKIRGWPPRLDLGCKTTKSTGYSHESTEITKSDHSTIRPEGVIDDLVISVDSWEYPADFVVL